MNFHFSAPTIQTRKSVSVCVCVCGGGGEMTSGERPNWTPEDWTINGVSPGLGETSGAFGWRGLSPRLSPRPLSTPPPLSPRSGACGHAAGVVVVDEEEEEGMRFRNASFLTLSLLGLCGLASLSWFAAFSSSGGGKTPSTSAGDAVDFYQREFLALRERLRSAEQENLRRSKELNLVLDEIKRAVAEKQALRDINRTWSSLSEETGMKLWNVSASKNFLQLPSVLHHLPHLGDSEDGLLPAVHVGQGRAGVSIVMGVPSVRREVRSYLTDTLGSLVSQLSAAEKDDCVIVVLVAEADRQYALSVADNLKLLPFFFFVCGSARPSRVLPPASSVGAKTAFVAFVVSFPSEIRSGLLEVVSPSVHFYPDLSHLRESFGDPKERVRWRSKQNLDYCFLMMYARTKGTYYVQLEDDIVARPAYLGTMKKFALQQPSDDWLILEFSQLGFIGKMFKTSDLSLIVEFVLMFYKDKPIDWLLDHIMWVKVCNPEKDAKHCDRQKANLRVRFKPSLFQHVGTHSSLAGKIQKLKVSRASTSAPLPPTPTPFRLQDKDFGKQKGHANPPAEVTTSLKTYQHFTLEKAYLGEDFFWAFTPAAGDFIRIRFFTPVRVERYFFRSGNLEHAGDKLLNTSVEVLPFDNFQADRRALTEGKDKSLKYHRTQDGFIRIGMFRKGIAEGEVDPAFGPLEAMRLTVIADSPVWIILNFHQESRVKSGSVRLYWATALPAGHTVQLQEDEVTSNAPTLERRRKDRGLMKMRMVMKKVLLSRPEAPSAAARTPNSILGRDLRQLDGRRRLPVRLADGHADERTFPPAIAKERESSRRPFPSRDGEAQRSGRTPLSTNALLCATLYSDPIPDSLRIKNYDT
ncbi:alpha-1,3-mannosyl-glycoprotein 4-beta-N-acetylglucosaminyltransferase B isoform X3 [Syngnathoides biaculeatus]|uniref:alpha-1,3-mannosyl-glycoprotein 4-beta-N-acetylglucosaminyltransferase B isoform X3 n=1 Tax=Syngnathoides biaculeatus TaxID=300417 RepID=UPI002ADE956E|nr:alpha-1,3-mannosyl-glycoprotein 4-beta-N-acetylglucosaminyltransferase B isoform X3 [Syngnathoides biaculeatus]